MWVQGLPTKVVFIYEKEVSTVTERPFTPYSKAPMNHNHEFREMAAGWRTGLERGAQEVRFLSTDAVRIWCSRMRRKNAQRFLSKRYVAPV